jgi:hypothetical protein
LLILAITGDSSPVPGEKAVAQERGMESPLPDEGAIGQSGGS